MTVTRNARYFLLRRSSNTSGKAAVGAGHRTLEEAQDARELYAAANGQQTAIYLMKYGEVPLFIEGDDLDAPRKEKGS